MPVALLALLPLTAFAAGRKTPAAGDVPAGDSLLQGLSFTRSKEPVTITADALEFDYRSRVLTYRGKVMTQQGDTQLQADLLTLTFEKNEGNRLESVVAEGNVRLLKGEREATAARAEFDQKERIVVLRKDAVVRSGQNEVRGEKITVYLDDERTIVEGGENRVHAVIYPQGTAIPTTAPTPAP